MPLIARPTPPLPRLAAGIALIEILVAMLVVTTGLLGLAGLETQSLRLIQGSQQRTQAILLANDMIERLRRNPAGVDGRHYDAAVSGVDDCIDQDCSPEQLARHDLSEWQRAIRSQLPGGEGLVCRGHIASPGSGDDAPDCDGGDVFIIAVLWNDGNRTGAGARLRFVTSVRP